MSARRSLTVFCEDCGCEVYLPSSGEYIMICRQCWHVMVAEPGKRTRPLHQTDWLLMNTRQRIYLIRLLTQTQLSQVLALRKIE